MKKLLTLAAMLALVVFIGCDEKSESKSDAGGDNVAGGSQMPGSMPDGGMPDMPGENGNEPSGQPEGGNPGSGYPGGYPEQPGSEPPAEPDSGYPTQPGTTPGQPGSGYPTQSDATPGQPGSGYPTQPGTTPGRPGIGYPTQPGSTPPGIPGGTTPGAEPGSTGPDTGVIPDAPRQGFPGNGGQTGNRPTSYPEGSAEDAVMKFIAKLNKDDFTGLEQIISSRSTGKIKEFRNGKPSKSTVRYAKAVLTGMKIAKVFDHPRTTEKIVVLTNSQRRIVHFMMRTEGKKRMIRLIDVPRIVRQRRGNRNRGRGTRGGNRGYRGGR